MDFDRLHILLVCNLGASTSVMVSKMTEVAEKSEKLKDVDIKIDAYPVSTLKEHIKNYDVILAGPQIKHKEKEIQQECDKLDKPFAIINSKDYGMVDGAAILKAAILLTVKHYKKNV